MKILVSAIALLVGSNVMAVAADQTLKFKLVTFYMGNKGGESHLVGVSVSPNGTIGTRTSMKNRVQWARPPDIAPIISPMGPSWRTIPT